MIKGGGKETYFQTLVEIYQVVPGSGLNAACLLLLPILTHPTPIISSRHCFTSVKVREDQRDQMLCPEPYSTEVAVKMATKCDANNRCRTHPGKLTMNANQHSQV